MMTWVQETLAQNDKSVTLKLMSVIENARGELVIANQDANYAASAHNAYVRKTINALFLSFSKYGKEVEIKQITSTRAEKALETGKDDETKLDL
jgi:sulfate adenylyltransferase subunit 1 (EFTu-like GTPase family)